MITTINEYKLIFENNLEKFVSKINALKDRCEKENIILKINFCAHQSIYLAEIIIPEDKRNLGLGKQIMKELTMLCDEYNIVIQVAPSNTFGSDITRLNNFYYKLGFTDNKGRKKDDRYLYDMIRKPKTK